MSRAAVSKSRAEKTKGGQSAPTPAIAHEIVPGKYNDHEWNFMVDRDDGDDFIGDLVEDVCQTALNIIYDKYIQRQLLPFTITQAKDAILQIIEWQFLARDEGEIKVDEEFSWMEDEEPLPALTDCWAQGLVPKRLLKSKTPEPVATIVEDVEDEEPVPPPPGSPATLQQEDPVPPPPGSPPTLQQQQELQNSEDKPEINDEDAEVIAQVETETKEVTKPSPPVDNKSKKRKKFRPYNGRIGSGGFKDITEALHHSETRIIAEERKSEQSAILEQTDDSVMNLLPASCHSILKAQAGRPPGNKDVIYDEQGNVLAVVKFDPSKLPTHFVKTQFTIVDPAVEAAQARLEAMRTGRYIPNKKHQKTTDNIESLSTASGAPVSSRKMLKVTKSTVSSVRSSSDKLADSKKKNMDVMPLPPPLLETMEVAPGVVVKEGNRTKKGPKPRPKKSDEAILSHQAALQPVRSYPNAPKYSAAEILDHSPILQFIQDSPPIPPIPSNRQIST